MLHKVGTDEHEKMYYILYKIPKSS